MMKAKEGTIIYMGSVASTKAYARCGAYVVAKHGLLGLARSVRESTRDSGLRVTALLPGATLTDSWNPAEVDEGELMPAGDVARAVLDIYMLSPRTVVEEVVLRPLRGDIEV
jgi:short-subunit dehydrogenase